MMDDPQWRPPDSDADGWKPPDTDKGDPVRDIKKAVDESTPGPTEMPPWSSYLPAIGATAGTAGLTLASLGAGPPGWLALAAAGGLGAGAGSLAKQAIEQHGVPKNAGDALTEAGLDAVIQGVAPELVGSATGAALGKIFNPERQYKLALRPQGSTEESGKAIQAGLKGKINLGWDTPAARAKNDARTTALNNEIDKAISSIPGGALSSSQWPATVQNKLDAVRSQWIMDPLNRKVNLEQIDEAERRFLINHGNAQPVTRTLNINGKQSTVTIANPEEMTLQELRGAVQDMPLTRAQDIKQASYRTTRSNKIAAPAAWDPMVQPGLDVDTRGAITSALREDLENYPGLEKLKDLNRDSGESQALDKALERFARKVPNELFKGIGNALAGGATGFLMGHSPQSIAYGVGGGLLNYALHDPLVRSRLAIALYGIREAPLKRAAAGLAGRAAVRLPFTAGKILVDADKAKQAPPELQTPQQAKGGRAKSDDYLREVERRAYSREATLSSLRH